MAKMTLTQLTQLLHVDKLTPNGTEKVAAPEVSFSKLAERCRKAAEDTTVDVDERALAEKTASVAVVAKVLAEIRALDGLPHTKVASESTKEAAFIQNALAEGHSPEDIASFLRSFAA